MQIFCRRGLGIVGSPCPTRTLSDEPAADAQGLPERDCSSHARGESSDEANTVLMLGGAGGRGTAELSGGGSPIGREGMLLGIEPRNDADGAAVPAVGAAEERAEETQALIITIARG